MATLTGEPPIVIAHRGASGYLPEHTLEGYNLAIDMGADFIEPDLVITKDGALVVRHDRHLGTTTDVADHPEFADRKGLKEGHDAPEWFVEDFTLAEIKTLRAKQPFAGRSAEYDGRFMLPTFAEVVALARDRSKDAGRPIGVYPETKHPGFFASVDLDFVEPLLETLGGFSGPAFIQSFEYPILEELRGKTAWPLIYLMVPPGQGQPDLSIEKIARFANGVGPMKTMLIDPETHVSSGFVEAAHKAGLAVHPWTFRDDQVGEGFPDIEAELRAYLALGIDGFFSDFADTAVSVRNGR